MQPYGNVNGDSNVLCYNIGNDYISVQFRGTPRIYRYTYASAGKAHVENMKDLARRGYGLNSYINRNVKYLYEK